ncbi:MAG: excinuclease ABC subunit UvrC [Verrucomicrobia bacterium]|nr:MAG: excinuclease ABC subunit UvrC [Verrucomicrobiota bacterium]
MNARELIRQKIGEMPHKPGIYLMKDRFGTVIYIGKARDLHKRVSSYFQPSRRQGWDLKFNALVDAIYDLDIHVVRNEPESLLLESKLIKEFQPKFNIDLRDDKNFLLLKINLNDPIPRFTLTRLRKEDGALYFGPFVHSSALRSTLAMARKKFFLRGCRAHTPGEEDYKHCLYGNLKHCTAPCISNVTQEDYLQQVRAAVEFMQGQTGELERQLEAEMKKASAALYFEKAAQMRDAIEDLRRTRPTTNKFKRIPYSLPLSMDPERDLQELADALHLKGPPERIEGFDISNIGGTFVVASLVSFRRGRPDRSNYRRFKMKGVTGQNDFASMAETVRRRYTRLLRENQSVPSMAEERKDAPVVKLPDLILIDGGKGQLGAAHEELKALGLGHIPIIGLAKENEEIYQPGVNEPLLLSHDRGALKLLQRVRDESHRFANTFNAQLRLKKISESILDDFPGIGDRRKAALLKKFGSIQRLRMATVEQIGEISGFGGKSAQDLKTFLNARSPVPPVAG